MLAGLKRMLREKHTPQLTLDFLKYVGPGLMVTVGFIDPGNWASNVAAGAGYGDALLWVVSLSTLMLIVLQHNAAHLGIATGLCLSEAATRHLPPLVSRLALSSAVAAAVATALAEILGGALALNMLFGLPVPLGAGLVALCVAVMLYANAYQRIERIIIGFVSLIGLSFIYELWLVGVDWPRALAAAATPALPAGAAPIVMSVLGAVVMPHNLFLHSEVIQTRQWNLQDESVIRRQLRFEFLDTLLSMLVGFAINSAMILLASAAFHSRGIAVGELGQAKDMLEPLLGPAAGVVFAAALLLAGVASSVTAGLAGGSIFAGIFGEPFHMQDSHTRFGVGLTLGLAFVCVLLVPDPFQGLIVSQILLSVQLPVTVLLQLFLTSSKKVMGRHANTAWHTFVLAAIAAVVIALNAMLLVSML
jgi:manganese transport protein